MRVLEREKEDDGRAAFGGRKAVFMPQVAGPGPGSPRRGRIMDGRAFRGAHDRLFHRRRQIQLRLRLPSKGIECDAISNKYPMPRKEYERIPSNMEKLFPLFYLAERHHTIVEVFTPVSPPLQSSSRSPATQNINPTRLQVYLSA
jgi:hypothetical protein